MPEDYIDRREIHWFPGHMMKTLRNIEKMLPMVDAVVQLLDARIPHSSLNPDLQAVYKDKPRLFLLNKADLADEEASREWLAHFRAEHSFCVEMNAKARGAAKLVRPLVESALAQLLETRREKGMAGAKTRLMITGIPNVGKSTFINNWAGSVKAKASDKPGVTRGQQWISTGSYELLDMPGVLCRQMESRRVALNLALIGSIPDRLLDVQEIAAGVLAQLADNYFGRLEKRYKLKEQDKSADGWQLLEAVGRRRGMLLPGAQVDTERAAVMVLDELRGGLLGRLSLERPGEKGYGNEG